jgi:hypothetical protein
MSTISKACWGIAALAAAAFAFFLFNPQAFAADLGGNCCADFEERIADLEAATARKGVKALSLKITGQVNKAVVYLDADDFSDQSVVENGASPTHIMITGEIAFRPGWAGGYVIDFGQGKSGLRYDVLTSDFGVGTDNDVYARQSYVFFKTPAGKVGIGQQFMATYDLSAATVANTDAAGKRLTLQPIGNVSVGLGPLTLFSLDLEPFNGKITDAVRYDTNVFAGFMFSAAWAGDDSWDAALKYAAEDVGGFKLLASVGYEKDKGDLLIGLLSGDLESETLTLNAGARHITSGLFAQVTYGRLKVEDETTDAYHVQAGIERKWFDLGATTLYGEYADWSDLNLSFYGLGFNQNVSDTVDFYATARRLELGDTDVDVVLGGARVKF